MTDEKPEFNVKGIPKELTIDNGPSFPFLRGDYKSKEERVAVREKMKQMQAPHEARLKE